MTAAEKQRRGRPLVATAPAGARLIRKYGNRRLYDTHTSRYVTLGDLLEVFAGPEDVQVIDAVSGEDLTKRVLAQAILFDEAARGTQIVPTLLLRGLLRLKGEVTRDVYDKKMQRLLAELGGRTAPGKPGDAAAEPAPGRELDELKRRLKALESSMGGNGRKK